jgi:peptidoglycan/LPS O-acetylase OafA/YrhL
VAILHAFGPIPVPAGNWAYVLTYTVNFDPHPPWLFGHLWSLSVEEQFYLLWPLAMKFARPPIWTGIAIASVFAGMVTRAFGLIDPALHYAFPFVCGPIAMGCLLAIYASRVRIFVTGSKFLSSGRFFLATVPAIALLDTLDLATVGHYIGLVTNLLLTLCVARLVFVPTGAAGRVLNSAPLVQLGKLSYSLYLFQQLFLDSMSTAPIPVPFPFNLFAAVGAALVCYYGVEVRFLGVRSRYRKPMYSGFRGDLLRKPKLPESV